MADEPHDEPVPPVSLGHPIVHGAAVGASHHRPGFDERPATGYERDEDTGLTSVAPPSAPDQVPRVSLSEQVTQRLRRHGGDAS